MDRHPAILFLPRFFRFGTYLNVKTGKLDSAMVILVFALTTFAISFTVWSLLQDNDFAKLHDLLYFFMIISHQLMIFVNKDEVLALIKILQRPLRDQDKKEEYSSVIKDYTHDVSISGSCMAFITFLTTFWSLTPILSLTNIVSPTTNKLFNLPLNWISHSIHDPTLHSAVSVISVLGLVCGNTFMVTWYPPLLYSVCKVKFTIRMLEIDMASLNDRAAQYCREYNKVITNSFRTFTCCPNCKKGPADLCAFGIYKSNDKANVNIDENKYKEGKECCKSMLRGLLLQECYKHLLKDVVERHVEILKLVNLSDRCYRLSVMMFNQMGILFPLLLIPKISILASLSITEILYGCTEIGGIFFSIFVINHIGQTVLDESVVLRQSLYLCRWEDAPVSVRRNLLIMQTVATPDLRLTAGTLYTLSMESFKNIMRAAYSYASLLQSLNDQ